MSTDEISARFRVPRLPPPHTLHALGEENFVDVFERDDPMIKHSSLSDEFMFRFATKRWLAHCSIAKTAVLAAADPIEIYETFAIALRQAAAFARGSLMRSMLDNETRFPIDFIGDGQANLELGERFALQLADRSTLLMRQLRERGLR